MPPLSSPLLSSSSLSPLEALDDAAADAFHLSSIFQEEEDRASTSPVPTEKAQRILKDLESAICVCAAEGIAVKRVTIQSIVGTLQSLVGAEQVFFFEDIKALCATLRSLALDSQLSHEVDRILSMISLSRNRGFITEVLRLHKAGLPPEAAGQVSPLAFLRFGAIPRGQA